MSKASEKAAHELRIKIAQCEESVRYNDVKSTEYAETRDFNKQMLIGYREALAKVEGCE